MKPQIACAKVKVHAESPYTFFITVDNLHYRYIKAQLDIEIYTGKEWISAKQCELLEADSNIDIYDFDLIHETSYSQGIYN